MLNSHRLKLLLGTLITFGYCTTVMGEDITVTDIAGRQVTLDAPAERVILGEGRQIYLLGLLEPEAPLLMWSVGVKIFLRQTLITMPAIWNAFRKSNQYLPLVGLRMAPLMLNRPPRSPPTSC